MKNMSPFQLGVLIFFGACIMLGVIFFSSFQGSSSSDQIGSVTIWGTYPSGQFDQFLQRAADADERLGGVRYVEIDAERFSVEVLEAIASGQAPDLLFVSNKQLYGHLNKVFALPSDSYAPREFQNTFAEIAEIYFQDGGIVGMPLAADPLVMYWNRDMFSSAGLARPPRAWSDFFALSGELSKVDENLNILQSALAFGESVNVDNLVEILATLVFQVGNPIALRDGDSYEATLDGANRYESAYPSLRFFTEFSNAAKSTYSWNRAMPDSQDAFLAGDLAVYFGLASEVPVLRQKNPNLNFAVEEIPDIDEETGVGKAVYADLYGFVIPRTAARPSASLLAAIVLTEAPAAGLFADLSGLAPVRRDLLVGDADETAFEDIMRRETLYAQTWLDPNPVETRRLFGDLIEYITSGRRSIEDAINVVNAELQRLLE